MANLAPSPTAPGSVEPLSHPAGEAVGAARFYKRLDALMLGVLLIAWARIDSLANAAVLPSLQQDVARQPWLGRLLSPLAMKLLAQQGFLDPIVLLLLAGAVACWLIYLLVTEWAPAGRATYRVKLGLIWAIVLLTVFAPSLELTLLRRGSGPASYSHDGGVIQTEATIDFLLQGRNPYAEDYTKTALAAWGNSEFRSALYHYPYLPWTFLFSAPFRLAADRLWGWYDQRFVYLLLFALTLALLPGLARPLDRGAPGPPDHAADREVASAGGTPRARGAWQGSLLLLMLIGLNPMMGSDLIFGQNDSFVLAWVVLSLWLWRRAREAEVGGACWRSSPPHPLAWYAASAVAFGLACASKPTAWFLAPFYVLLLARPAVAWRGPSEAGGGPGRKGTSGRTGLSLGSAGPGVAKALSRAAEPKTEAPLASPGREGSLAGAYLGRAVRRGWPALAAALLVIGPYFVWNPARMIDDVWSWSAGTSATSYQIWGWGASNFVIALGWVGSRLVYWPFWIPELLLGLPLFALLCYRQFQSNTAARAC